MENMHARKALALAVVSVLSLGLAACSSGGGSKDVPPLVIGGGSGGGGVPLKHDLRKFGSGLVFCR